MSKNNPVESENLMMTPLVESAIRLNEIFKALLKAGFSENQALTLIQKSISNQGKAN
jgi:hypothetical protein